MTEHNTIQIYLVFVNLFLIHYFTFCAEDIIKRVN